MLVACGVIRRDGRILIAQRRPTSRLEPLKWEFPGGKIEFGEPPPDALRREIREELDFEISVGPILCVSSHAYGEAAPSTHLLMLAYDCAYVSGTPAARDVHDFRWIGEEDFGSFDFAAADLPVIAAILSGAGRSDRATTVAELKGLVARFVAEREWRQFHSPKNLSMSITIEAAELMEHFQWLTVEESRRLPSNPEAFDAIGQEVADVAMYVLSLCNSLNLDLSDAIVRKLKLNREKYPAEKYRGKHTA